MPWVDRASTILQVSCTLEILLRLSETDERDEAFPRPFTEEVLLDTGWLMSCSAMSIHLRAFL